MAVMLRNADVNLVTTGTATGTVTVSGSGTVKRVITISNITGDGTIRISIRAGTASNSAGSALATGPGQAFEVDSESINQGSWPMSGHDAQHTCRSPFVGPALPKQMWAFNPEDFPGSDSCPVIDSNGTLYVGGGDSIYAISKDGREKWWREPGWNGGTTVAIGKGGTLYAAIGWDELLSISAKGHTWWEFGPQDYNDTIPPVVDSDGTVYTATAYWGDSLYAVTPDGREKWRFAVDGGVWRAPVIGLDGTVYVLSCGKLYAINKNGSRKWVLSIGASALAIGPDGTIYCASGCQLSAISPMGRKEWEFPMHPGIDCRSIAIGSDGTIYAGCQDIFYAVRPDGTQKWQFPLYESFYSFGSYPTPALVDALGTIYVGALHIGENYGEFYAINPDGSRKWEVHLRGMSAPAMGSDGTLYFCSGNGLCAYGPDNSTTRPSLMVDGPVLLDYDSNRATYTVTYRNAADISLRAADIKLSTTGTAKGTAFVSYKGNNAFEVVIGDTSGLGTIGISIAAGTARNAAGAAGAAGPSKTFAVAYAPTLRISPPSSYSTRKDPISYTLSYTDATCIALTAADVTLITSGTAKGSVSVTGSGKLSRKITISDISGEGAISIRVRAETSSNAGGPDRYPIDGESFAVRTPPTIGIFRWWSNPISTGPTDYYVSYWNADKVTLSLKNIMLIKTGTANGVVSVSGTGNSSRTVTISNIVGDGTLAISVVSSTASNSNGYAPPASGEPFQVVNHPPRISIGQPSQTSTKSGPVRYVVTYSGADWASLSEESIHLNKTGTATGSVSVSETGPTTEIVTISKITGDGSLGISIDAGSAENVAGYSDAAGPSATFAVNNTPPTIRISAPSVASTKSGPVSYIVTCANAESVFLPPAKVHLRTTGTATGRVSVTVTGKLERTVTISKIKGKGTVGISIDSRTASNAGGYAPAAGPSATFAVKGLL